METKQTACDWLIEHIKNGIDFEDGSIDLNWLHDGVIDQAKALEKQRIIDAVFAGYNYDGGRLEEMAEQYYNETYTQIQKK